MIANIKDKKDKSFLLFQSTGILLILIGIVALINDTLYIMPYFIKSAILYLLAVFFLLLGERWEDEQ